METTRAIISNSPIRIPISAIIFDYVLNWTKFSIVQILSVGIILYSIYQLSINQSEANKNFH
jgi:hypothetical protein